MADGWGVVIPVKRLSIAKSRLASYGDRTRQELALAFAADVVLAASEVTRVLVVTDDPEAASALGALGAEVVADDPDAGLNPALEHGVELLRGGDSGLGVATLSADLPALQPEELAAALAQVAPGRRAFVADEDAAGTTLLAAGPGADLGPAFGPGSRLAHLVSGAVELDAGAGLRRDVDTPADLDAAALLGVGPHTRAVLERLG